MIWESRRDERRPEEGASAVEYGLFAAAIAALIVAMAFLIGGVINAGFTTTCDIIDNAPSTSPRPVPDRIRSSAKLPALHPSC